MLIHSWPTHIDRRLLRDIAVNVLTYVPVGVFGFLTLRQNFRPAVAATVTLLSARILSCSIEMIQYFDDERFCNAPDVVSNVCGTALGVVLGCLYQRWLKWRLVQAETSGLPHPSGAMSLFYTWLPYQNLPHFPALSGTRPHEKLGEIFTAISPSPFETFTCFAEWLVAAQLLKNVLGRKRTYRWFPLLLLEPPAPESLGEKNGSVSSPQFKVSSA